MYLNAEKFNYAQSSLLTKIVSQSSEALVNIVTILHVGNVTKHLVYRQISKSVMKVFLFYLNQVCQFTCDLPC